LKNWLFFAIFGQAAPHLGCQDGVGCVTNIAVFNAILHYAKIYVAFFKPHTNLAYQAPMEIKLS